MTKFAVVAFIEEETHRHLLETKTSQEKIHRFIFNTYDSFSPNQLPELSVLTKANQLLLDEIMGRLLFLNTYRNSSKQILEDKILSHKELDYVKDHLKEEMFSTEYHEDEKYYDITTTRDSDILVVVKRGFLGYLMKSKDNLLKFILTCLHSMDELSVVNNDLFKTYIRLKFNDNYFNLIKTLV